MIGRRIRYWLNRGERARLLREEMEIHLEMKIQELMEDGMQESDARDAARRQFGNFARTQEESRETWIARWASDLAKDIAFAFRMIRNSIPTGFAHRNLLIVGFDPSMTNRSAAGTQRTLDAILKQAGSIPGVESASLGSSVPLDLAGTHNLFTAPDEDRRVPADIYSIAPIISRRSAFA